MLILSLVMPFASTQVSAANFNDVKVLMVRVDNTGIGMVFFDQFPSTGTSPSCINAAAYKSALAFDSNTAGGKSILATALAAKATGALVNAYGANKCNIFNGGHVEDLEYMISR